MLVRGVRVSESSILVLALPVPSSDVRIRSIRVVGSARPSVLNGTVESNYPSPGREVFKFRIRGASSCEFIQAPSIEGAYRDYAARWRDYHDAARWRTL